VGSALQNQPLQVCRKFIFSAWFIIVKKFRFARAVSNNTTRSQDFLTVGAGYSGHNQMLHDFGLSEKDSNSEIKVEN